jgi:hypothetical protein
MTISIVNFLNQVIHSIFFEVKWDEGELLLAVCSDHRFQDSSKNSGLLWISLKRIVAAFREIANDDIIIFRSELNPETGVREQMGFRERKNAEAWGTT